MISITLERPDHGSSVEGLYDTCFGASRYSLSSYAVRTGRSPVRSLSRVAIDQSDYSEGQVGRLVGAIRFWPIDVLCLLTGRITHALLLGPFAIDPAFQGRKLGQVLMKEGLNAAFQANHHTIMLVGDVTYYSRFGFERAKPRTITMPGGRDADRLLIRQTSGLADLPSVGVVQAAHRRIDDHNFIRDDGSTTDSHRPLGDDKIYYGLKEAS